MQTALSKTWTRVAVSISNDDNHYIKSAYLCTDIVFSRSVFCNKRECYRNRKQNWRNEFEFRPRLFIFTFHCKRCLNPPFQPLRSWQNISSFANKNISHKSNCEHLSKPLVTTLLIHSYWQQKATEAIVSLDKIQSVTKPMKVCKINSLSKTNQFSLWTVKRRLTR